MRVYRCLRSIAKGLHWYETKQYLPDYEYFTTGLLEIPLDRLKDASSNFSSGTKGWPGVFEYRGEISDGLSVWVLWFYGSRAALIWGLRKNSDPLPIDTVNVVKVEDT